MSRTLVIQNYGFRKTSFVREKTVKRTISKGNVRISLATYGFVLAGIFIFLGAFYLYQVNSIATKGFEIKEVENKIQELEKENKKMQIKEVELKSMHNIEKATENLNLVNSANVSYLEINGPVAMR